MQGMSRGLWLGVALILVGGCVTSPSADEQGASPLPIEPAQAEQVGYLANWYQDLSLPRGQRVVSARRAGGLLLVREAPEPMISAVNVSDGSIRWRAVVGDRDDAVYDPTRSGDRVFVASGTQFHVLNAISGQRVKVENFEVVARTAPLLIENLAVFGGTNGLVFAKNWQRWIQPWTFALPGRLDVAPVKSGSDVLIGGTQGNYALVNALNGSARWRGRTFGAIVASPVAGEDIFYMPSTDRTLYALDATSGEDRWTYRAKAELTEDPTLLGDTLYLPVPGQATVALNAQAGDVRWRLSEPLAAVAERTETDELLLHSDRKLVLVRSDSGVTISEAATRPLQAVVTGPDSSALLVSRDGHLQRINPAP